ncbi:MAG: MXAN_5187 family protein [Polyangiales bacterium]
MFSRFWFFVIAAFAGAAMAAAFLGQAAYNRLAAGHLDEQLRRDRFEVELFLRLDGRARLDAIDPMTRNGDVRAVLEESNARAPGAPLPAASRQRLEQSLGALNRQLDEGQADILIVVDKNREIVAQLGGGTPALGAKLDDYPALAQVLQGEDKADLWMRNELLYRIAVRPVQSGGQTIGAVVHAMEVDEDLSRRLADRIPGATVAFFRGNQVLSATAGRTTQGAPDRTVVQHGLADALIDPKLRTDGRTEPTEVHGAQVVYALFEGKPLEGTVGYAVARPRVAASSPMALFSDAPAEDVRGLPWPLIALLPLLFAILGIVFEHFERDRPQKAFDAALKKIAETGQGRLPSADFRGGFRLLAEDVNSALDKVAQSAGATAARRPANLDDILGQAPASEPGGAYFGFASRPSIPEAAQAFPSVPEAPRPKAPPAAIPDAPPPPPPAPPAAPKAAPPPPEPPAPPAVVNPPSIATQLDGDEDDEGATMVAAIPRELLQASGEINEEEQHFRQIFDEFVRVKEQCGEPTKGLTYDKFVVTLRKNKEQIVSKHGAANVRFTVYVKDGKAALKATPVR